MRLEKNNEIIFTFDNGKEELVIDGSSFDVIDYDGIESTDYEIVTEDNINHIGARVKRKKLLKRLISVEFDYVAITSIEEVAAQRRRLTRFFTPYSSGLLTIKLLGIDRQIEYEVQKFKINNKTICEPLSCLVELVCVNPELLSAVTVGQKIMTLVGGWKWKFSLPFRMKQYGPLKKNIYIDGDMETPVEIYFRGPAVNPMIKNHRTGEHIKIMKTLTSNDTMYINTAYRQKTVEIVNGNERENAWDNLDFSSKFFWLYPGDNMIEFSGDSEPEKTRGVEIYYRERYLGI